MYTTTLHCTACQGAAGGGGGGGYTGAPGPRTTSMRLGLRLPGFFGSSLGKTHTVCLYILPVYTPCLHTLPV